MKCANCGKEIETDRSIQRFCNKSCRYRFHNPKKEEIEKVCPQCGKTFTTNRLNKIFCQLSCNEAFNSKRHYHRTKTSNKGG